MEVRLQIEYAQLLSLVRQLPVHQLLQLKQDILIAQAEPAFNPPSDKQKLKLLLLHGPVMSAEQYQLYLENRLWMNQWRKTKPCS
jgi:hypothetical protein